jgi:uncharacterized protein (TIGR01777 family)
MSNKVVIAGGTGFVGKYLTQKFTASGYEVIIISRQQQQVQWHDENAIITALENAELLINLAGKSVDCRYNEKNKKEIYDSRIDTTNILGNALLQCKNAPGCWINSSTATIYRHAEDRPMTESSGEIGKGFSVNVAGNWEKSFFSFQLPATRQVALRMAIVLGKEGGVVPKIKNLVRFGLGGKQGNGRQMFSWIHIEDLYQVIIFLAMDKNLNGVFNTAAPKPVTNAKLMGSFRRAMKMPVGIPTPKWLLKFGAILIKTETELVLKSRWVIPERLLQAGFLFTYVGIDEALNEILN